MENLLGNAERPARLQGLRSDRHPLLLQVPRGSLKRCTHGGRKISPGQGLDPRSLGEVPARLEPVGQVDHAVERAHLGRADRVLGDRRENGGILDREQLARQLGAQPSVEHDRVGPFEGVDRQAARLAFSDQPFGRIEPREVVEQAGGPGGSRVQAVGLGERIGQARDPDGVGEAVRLR